MTDSTTGRKNIALFLVILALSAATMMYLFWRFPIITAMVTLTVLALLGVSARLARYLDASDLTEREHREQSV
jgi:hypothetical protein